MHEMASAAIEELESEIGFQGSQRPTDGWLRDRKVFGRSCGGASTDDCLICLQLPDVKIFHVFAQDWV